MNIFVVLITGATFLVNSSVDMPDINVGDGICATALGDCTLRAAVQEANALAGIDTIGFSISPVYLDSALYSTDSLYIRGSVSVDTVYCGFAGICLGSTSYLEVRRLHVNSAGTGIYNQGHLLASSISVEADSFAVFSSHGRTEIRNSRMLSRYWRGVVSYHDTTLVIRNSYIRGVDEALRYYTDGLLAPDSILNDTLISDTSRCVSITMNGKNTYVRNNILDCHTTGIWIYDELTNPAVMESVFVDSNRIVITGRGGTGVYIRGCYYCDVGYNLLEGTDSSGTFVYLLDSKYSTVRYNANLNDAGRYNLVVLENTDSSVVRGNRWVFSVVKDSTGGIEVGGGSDYNLVDSNYVENVIWGGISVFDSSSHNLFYMDSLINTSGIHLRPYWRGRYSFPVYIDTAYTGSVGTGNVFLKVYSYGRFSAMTVSGMDTTVVDSSTLETADLWGRAIINAGSRLAVLNSILKGASTLTDTGGYGISLEYYYGTHAVASEYLDDILPEIYVENTVFQDFAYAFRVVDMDTSYIKLDTLFDDNGNTIAGYTYGYYGGYYLPVVVQTFDLSCNLSILAIDSIRMTNRWGGYRTLDRINASDALWSFHWEPSATVYYDSLYMWYPVRILHYDELGNLNTSNPYTVTLYGENGNTLDYSVDVERGLVSYVDPCPVSGYPKTVDSRWLVIKVQYDPGYLPVSNPEGKGLYFLTIGRNSIAVNSGDEVEIYTLSGRLVERMRVSGNRTVHLNSGVYILRIVGGANRTLRLIVF